MLFAKVFFIFPTGVAMLRNSAIVVLGLALTGCSEAQRTGIALEEGDEVCGTAEPTAAELQRFNLTLAAFKEAKAAAPTQALVDTVPVYVWVIRDGTLGHVSAEAVDTMINLLNSEIDGTQFHFQLVRRTEITDHPEWYLMDSSTPAESTAKRTLRIGRGDGDTLNIWTADPGKNDDGDPLTGYARRGGELDGLVIKPTRVATSTSVHETGHWLGLRHTFFGGCSEPNDGAGDTPQQRNEGSGCPVNRNTCRAPGDDPVINYMNYGTCRREFTPDQRGLMDVAAQVGRAATPLFLGDSVRD
jgi:hypothetical protein